MTDIIKIFAPAVLAFAVGIAMTPMLTHYLFHFKVWKKTPGKYALDGTAANGRYRHLGQCFRNDARMLGNCIFLSFLAACRTRLRQPFADMDSVFHAPPRRMCRLPQ